MNKRQKTAIEYPCCRAMPIEGMRLNLRRKGVSLAKSLLNGVGERPMVFVTDPIGDAIHVQKPLTSSEIELLPMGWLDIPAVDERGSYQLLRV